MYSGNLKLPGNAQWLDLREKRKPCNTVWIKISPICHVICLTLNVCRASARASIGPGSTLSLFACEKRFSRYFEMFVTKRHDLHRAPSARSHVAPSSRTIMYVLTCRTCFAGTRTLAHPLVGTRRRHDARERVPTNTTSQLALDGIVYTCIRHILIVCVRAPDADVFACVCARRRVDKRGRMMLQLQVNVIRDWSNGKRAELSNCPSR